MFKHGSYMYEEYTMYKGPGSLILRGLEVQVLRVWLHSTPSEYMAENHQCVGSFIILAVSICNIHIVAIVVFL